ncbi:hypothetical protein GQ53DRAFT_651365, partial [Thozetella sp. PMI_491]
MSVFIPTVLRQFISYGVEAGFDKTNVPPWLRTTIGTLSGAGVAVVTHAIGFWRDKNAGTATPTSRRSRVIMAGTALAAAVAELATNTAAGSASTHFAFTMYTGMRDLMVQSRVRLQNPNTSGTVPDWTHFGLMMVGYGIDQGLVNLAMSRLASPSGSAAWNARSSFVEQIKHALARGGLNLLGEIGEDLMFQAIPSVRSQIRGGSDAHVLQLTIEDVGYQKGYLANGALGPWAVRTGILSTTTAILAILTPRLANDPALLEGTSDLVVALVNGLLYEPFANSGSGQPSPVRTTDAGDEESGKEYSPSSDATSIRSYMHPNADMSNCNTGSRRIWTLPRRRRRPRIVVSDHGHDGWSFVQPQRGNVLCAQKSVTSKTSICIESINTSEPDKLATGGSKGIPRTQDFPTEYAAAMDQESEREQLRAAAGGIATIDLGALRRNFRLGLAMLANPKPGVDGQQAAPRRTRAAAVVKANAYGLGADIVSKTLVSEGCRDFFVARIGEAVELRRMLQSSRPDLVSDVAINVLDGNLVGADPRLLIKYKITPVLNSLQQVREWNAAGVDARRQLPAVLQFDSGMSR